MFAVKLPTSLPAGLEEPAVVPALLALEHPPRCPGTKLGRIFLVIPEVFGQTKRLMCEISISHQ